MCDSDNRTVMDVFFRMDIVVKADSVFRGDDDSTAVSCAVTGKITKMSVKGRTVCQ